MTLGLTGGMGCGKTTALRFFAEQGWRTLDSDAIVRDQVLGEPEVAAAIGAHFSGVQDTTGAVRRDELAARVFAEGAEDELSWLEARVLPRVLTCWQKALGAEPAANWVIEAPLLFEKNLEKWFDFTACVAASSSSQLARLTGRGFSPALAGQRISRQLPLAKKIELADFVLSNDGTPEALREQIVWLTARLGSVSH